MLKSLALSDLENVPNICKGAFFVLEPHLNYK